MKKLRITNRICIGNVTLNWLIIAINYQLAIRAV